MSPARFKRLKSAIQPSRDNLKPFRRELAMALRQYLGQHYANGDTDSRPINMIEMAITTYLEALSSRNPQVLCVTHSQELRPSAVEMEMAINEQLKRMDFATEHRQWVLSALFSVGIIKTALEVTDTAVVDEEDLPQTRVFVETIMLDDWVHDMSASKWGKQVTFCGNLYRMPLEEAKSNRHFDRDMRKLLTPRQRSKGDDKTDHLGQGNEGSFQNDEFVDMVELWDMWVPLENQVITFPVNDGGEIPLRTVNWKGPKHGPYRMLGFNPVLNNVLPLAPVSTWLDLDDLENKLYSQLGQQASRQKTIVYATVQGKTDAERSIKSSDGDTVCVDNPNAVKEVRFGGVDQQNLGFAMNVKSMANYVMGNLDAVAGLATTAGTLGQEKIIKDSTNDRMRAMQTAVAVATRGVIEDIAFWMFRHPTIEMTLKHQISGTDIELDVPWPYQEDENGIEEDVRKGDFDKYKIDIQPYSMQDTSPGQRLQLIRDLWQRDILPLTQLGLKPDTGAYMALIAKYADLPELLDLVPDVKLSQPEQQGGGGGEMRKAPVTSREYVRRNVSEGRSPAAQQQQESMMLLGASPKTNGPGGSA